MEKVDYMISLEELFKRDKFQISDLVKALNIDEGDEIINRLFLFLNTKIDNFHEGTNLDYLQTGVGVISDIIEEYSSVNHKMIKKKTKKLYEKIVRIQTENIEKFQNPIETLKEFKKVILAIDKLEEVNLKRESKYFGFLKFITCDIKSLDYLEETLKRFPNIVNAKDKKERTIFSTIFKEYLTEINSDEFNREKIMYYSNVLSLIKSHVQFELDSKDKSYCNSKLKQSISKLYYQDDNYSEKKELLADLKNFLQNEDVEKIGIGQLLENYHISTAFPRKVKNEIDQLMRKPKKVSSGRVIVDDYIITIDGLNAKEIDDALSIKKLENGNYLLGVHIASVLGYLSYKSPSVVEAISRSSSIYLPGRCSHIEGLECDGLIPIFPYQFSAGSASLIQGKPRLTNSYFFEIDSHGDIVDSDFRKTVISNSKKCNYQEINNVIKKGTTNPQLENTVKLLDELTYKLEEKDQAKSIYLDIKNKKIDPSDAKVSTNSRAERIVGQMMRLTNSKIADYFAHSSEGYPFLYRVHEMNVENISELESAIKKLSPAKDREKFDNLYNALTSMYPSAYYDLEGSHEGLGLKHYCHGTSPLRRSADIVVEHALDVCYFKRPSDKDLYLLEENIKENRDIINAKNNDIDYFIGQYCREKQKIKTR